MFSFIAGTYWQKQVIHYLPHLLEQNSTSKKNLFSLHYLDSQRHHQKKRNFFFRDIFADANILQGAIFHEETAEDIEENEIPGYGKVEDQDKPRQSKPKKQKHKPKPAAHRVTF